MSTQVYQQNFVRPQAETTDSLVSVVIPCYKQARYVGEAIESVLNQTYPHFEIIVVDDGSPDNTAEVVGRYPEARYVRQENQGVAAARNTGLKASTGRYVIFLDADDRLMPEALEANLGCLKAHPECVLVAGRVRSIDADGRLLPTTYDPLVEQDHYLHLLRNNYIWMPGSAMYRREVFDRVGLFNGSRSPSEDYDMYMRVARQFPIRCHEKIVAEYRQHGLNASGNPERMLRATMTVYRAQRPFVKGDQRLEEAYQTGEDMWQKRYGEWTVNKARNHLWQGIYEMKLARNELKQAARSLLALVQYSPQVFVQHLRRRLSAIFFKSDS